MEEKMSCPRCETDMNHHADKMIHGEAEEETITEIHACPACGETAAREKKI